MARLSDIIENFIKEMLTENGGQQILIQRNELADQFRCAPSQINYVLTTRFTCERGFLIESRRGGGGHIIIKHITYDGTEKNNRMIYESIGESITYHNAASLISNLFEINLITEREMEIMKIAINDRTISGVDEKDKNKIRADILKSMIMTVLI